MSTSKPKSFSLLLGGTLSPGAVWGNWWSYGPTRHSGDKRSDCPTVCIESPGDPTEADRM